MSFYMSIRLNYKHEKDFVKGNLKYLLMRLSTGQPHQQVFHTTKGL